MNFIDFLIFRSTFLFQKTFKIGKKEEPKFVYRFWSISGRFWSHFGRFLVDFGAIFFGRFLVDFWIRFLVDLESIWPKWLLKNCWSGGCGGVRRICRFCRFRKNSAKCLALHPFGGAGSKGLRPHAADPPNGPKGAEMDPKRVPTGPKGVPKGPKGTQKETQGTQMKHKDDQGLPRGGGTPPVHLEGKFSVFFIDFKKFHDSPPPPRWQNWSDFGSLYPTLMVKDSFHNPFGS